MKNKKAYIAVVCITLWAVLCIPDYREVASFVAARAETPVVVLDPGHGGIDGGAESSRGISEKDINLSIALELRKQLQQENIRVIMTRQSDKGLYGPKQKGTIRSLKTCDMKERKRIIDEAGAALTVSIHLNSFTQDSSVRGAQVFYPSEGEASVTSKSEEAARLIQQAFNDSINKEKKREELGKNDVFLFRDIRSPIVIAECGFLSNQEEAENLKEGVYQQQLSKVLKKGICTYLDENRDINH